MRGGVVGNSVPRPPPAAVDALIFGGKKPSRFGCGQRISEGHSALALQNMSPAPEKRKGHQSVA